jgi:hypothetical protein
MTHDHDSSIATGRAPEQFGVQAWSQGDLYPAVIYQREVYAEFPRFADWYATAPLSHSAFERYQIARELFYAETALEERYRYTSHVLALDGIEEEYATHADAEEVARALLGSPFFRAQWQQSAEFDPEREYIDREGDDIVVALRRAGAL